MAGWLDFGGREKQGRMTGWGFGTYPARLVRKRGLGIYTKGPVYDIATSQDWDAGTSSSSQVGREARTMGCFDARAVKLTNGTRPDEARHQIPRAGSINLVPGMAGNDLTAIWPQL